VSDKAKTDAVTWTDNVLEFSEEDEEMLDRAHAKAALVPYTERELEGLRKLPEMMAKIRELRAKRIAELGR
jgi:hypothetical protein